MSVKLPRAPGRALTEAAGRLAGLQAKVVEREELLIRGGRDAQLGSVAGRQRVAVEDEARAAGLFASALRRLWPAVVGARGGEAGAGARFGVHVQVTGLHGECALPRQFLLLLPQQHWWRGLIGAARLRQALLARPARILLEEGCAGRRLVQRPTGRARVGGKVPVRCGLLGVRVQPRVRPQREVRGLEEVQPGHWARQEGARGHIGGRCHLRGGGDRNEQVPRWARGWTHRK